MKTMILRSAELTVYFLFWQAAMQVMISRKHSKCDIYWSPHNPLPNPPLKDSNLRCFYWAYSWWRDAQSTQRKLRLWTWWMYWVNDNFRCHKYLSFLIMSKCANSEDADSKHTALTFYFWRSQIYQINLLNAIDCLDLLIFSNRVSTHKLLVTLLDRFSHQIT